MKRIIIIVLIAVLAAAAAVMLYVGQQGAQATLTWCVGSPGPDNFTLCIHDGAYGYPNDTWVTLGMEAIYNPNAQYAYASARWVFDAGYGGNYTHDYDFYDDPYCSYVFNQYGYYQGTAFCQLLLTEVRSL